MSNKSRFTGSMKFRGKIKRPDTFQRINRLHRAVGSFAVRQLQALSNPRADGKPHRDTETNRLKQKRAVVELVRKMAAHREAKVGGKH